MSDHDSVSRVLKAAAEDALSKLAQHKGTDPLRLLQAINDVLTLDDRIEFVDARVWLAEEIEPVEPDIGIISGRETGLFYRGCVNMLYGTDNCGKTLLMQALVVQQLEAGNEVLYLDGEEGSPRNMFLRLQSMGCNMEWGDRLHYANVTRPPSAENRAMFVDVAKRCSLVVLDSGGEFMGMFGKDAVKDLETRSVLFEMFGRPLAAAGPAVVILDHIAKSSDGSQPIGTIRKRAAVDGAAYFLSVNEGNEWSKTKNGYGGLTCTKDRNGTYFRGQYVARIQVFPAAESVDGQLVVELSYTELDDMIEDDEPVAPPAIVAPVDVELEVIRIIQAAEMPVGNRYIIDQLNQSGHSYTKKAFEAFVKNMRERGFLEVRDGYLYALITAPRFS